ncbi:DUF945 family protein [Aeromonas schubertii]|uniref:Lipoprotein n=1 Tax=Aeromonas schubertii TaxID=652 RepID=A0A0S2SGE6_9GAMM|nr:DUF945 family protein [Aeromonas schubertii]ALP40748.1 hypothetical protein WL1483_1329 [Aeromonas schubertii]
MKKRVTGGVAVLLLAGAAGSCWYTGQRIDEQIPVQFAKIHQETGLQLEWLPAESGLFRRDGDVVLTLSPELLQSLGAPAGDDKALRLYLHSRTTIFPLYGRTRVTLDKERGDLAALLKELGLQAWEPILESRTSYWNGRNASRLTMPEVTLDEQGSSIALHPLTLNFNGDLKGNGRLTFDWQGLRYRESDEPIELTLEGASGSADLDRIAGLVMVPASEGKVAALSLSAGEGFTLKARGLHSSSRLEGDDADTLGSQYETGLERLDLEMEGESIALSEGILSMRLKGMDLEGYRALQQANGADLDPAKLEQALDQLLGRGMTLELDRLSARINGEPVTIKGNLVLSSTTLAQLTNGVDGWRALSGQFDASVSGKLGEALPQAAPLLRNLTGMGYFKPAGDTLKAEVILSRGKVTINGLPAM